MTSKHQFVGERELVKLSEIAKVKAGNVAPKKEAFTEDGIPFVRAGSLTNLLAGESLADLEKIDGGTAQKLRLTLFPAGTVVFAKSGMSCMTGNVYVLPKPCYVVSHLACVIPNGDYASYLKHYFRYNRPNRLIENPSFPSIKLSKIRGIELRLPSPEEGIRQVQALERIEGQIEQAKALLTHLDSLVKSRFVEIFGDFACYETKPLIKCVDCIEAGKSPKCLAFSRKMAEPGVLKLSAISSGVYCENENKALPRSVSLTIDKVVHANDILLSRKNTPELVGRSVLVKHTDGNIMFPDIIFRMHPLPPINAMYLSYLLAGPLLHSIQSLAHGSAKSMSNIPKSELAKLSIPIPALNLQNEFANFASQVDKSRFVAQQQIEKLQLLYDSLAQEYFGE